MTTPRGRNATDRVAPSKAGQRPGCDHTDLSDRLKMPRPPIRPSCRHVSDWPSVWTLQLANHEHAKPNSATAVDGGWSCDDTCLFCCMARAGTTNHLRCSSPCSPHLSQPGVTQYRTAHELRQDQSEAETQGWPRGLCQGHNGDTSGGTHARCSSSSRRRKRHHRIALITRSSNVRKHSASGLMRSCLVAASVAVQSHTCHCSFLEALGRAYCSASFYFRES